MSNLATLARLCFGPVNQKTRLVRQLCCRTRKFGVELQLPHKLTIISYRRGGSDEQKA